MWLLLIVQEMACMILDWKFKGIVTLLKGDVKGNLALNDKEC